MHVHGIIAAWRHCVYASVIHSGYGESRMLDLSLFSCSLSCIQASVDSLVSAHNFPAACLVSLHVTQQPTELYLTVF